MGHPKVRQHMIVDGCLATQPAVGVMLITQPRQPPGAANSLHRRIYPQGQQHPRVRRRMPGPVQHCLDRGIKGRQFQTLQQCPDGTSGMVIRQERVQVPRHPLDLVTHSTINSGILGISRWSNRRCFSWDIAEHFCLAHNVLRVQILLTLSYNSEVNANFFTSSQNDTMNSFLPHLLLLASPIVQSSNHLFQYLPIRAAGGPRPLESIQRSELRSALSHLRAMRREQAR